MKNKDISKGTLKEKVLFMVKTLDIDSNDKTFSYYEDMMNEAFTNDKDLPLIKNKMDNLISLLEKSKNKSEEDFLKILNINFENELFYMI